MPPTKEISYGEKVTIRHMFGLGIPAKEIGAKLGRHPALIRKHIAIIKTVPPNELLPPPKKRPGRKGSVADPNPDPPDPHVFGPPGS